MVHANSNTALIFFSRSAEQEGIAKTWLGNGNKKTNTAIARLLIEKAKANVAQSEFDVFHFDERLQRGANFGSRLANAFADVFAMGYASAVAVGNDSPELAQLDWANVQTTLDAGGAVMGPTLRGGAYLIGLQANAFEAEAFAALPWQTREVCQHLTAYLQASHTSCVAELPVLQDLNSANDLHSYLQHHQDDVAVCLAQLLFSKPKSAQTPENQYETITQQATPLRGPPAEISCI